MKYSFFKSIRGKLLLLAFISVLPALGIIVYGGLDRQRHSIEDAKNNALRVLTGLAYNHEHTVESTRQFLATLAQLPDIQNQNAHACNKIFEELLKKNPSYANIFAATADGMVYANALPFTPHSITHRKYYRNILKLQDFSVGENTKGITLQRPVLHLAYPVMDAKGHLSGVVTVALDLDSFRNIFTKTRLPEGSVFAVSDHKHVRLYRYPDQERFVGKNDLPDMIQHMSATPVEGSFTAHGADGVKRLYAYKRFYLKGNASPYLFMRVGIPEEKALALAHANKSLFISVSFLLFAFTAALGLAWIVGNIIIAKKVKRLVSVSRAVSHGDLSTRTKLNHSEDELGKLASAFDEMAKTLERNEIQRTTTEKNLQESEAKYRNIFENAIGGIYQSSPKGTFLSVNPVLASMLGYGSPEELIEEVTDIGVQIYVKQDDRVEFLRLIQEKGKVVNFEQQMIKKDGSLFWASINARVVKDESGKVIYYEGTIEDINARRLAEDALSKSERKLADIIEFLPDATFVIDLEGKVIAWNRALEEMTGIKKKDMIGQGDHAYTVPFYGERRQQLMDLIDTDSIELESKYQNVQRKGNTLFAEVFTPTLYQGNGAYIWATGAPLFDDKGNRVGAIESMRDVTDNKLAVEQIKASLREKEVLLKELQHRVKNNLLTISSVLALQLNHIEDNKSRDAFITSMNRINAMTKIHTRLYQSENYSLINFKEYIEELIWELSRSHGFLQENMFIDIKDVSMDVNTAIPVGLIVNELISNAIKHAFPDGRKGNITITMSSNGSNIILTVSDNGIGLPGHIDFKNTTSVGLSLIHQLVEQIDGNMELERNNGTQFIATFSIN